MKVALPLLKSPFFVNGAVFSLLVLCSISCKKDKEDLYDSTKQDAKIRFINASKKSTAVDLFVDDIRLNKQAISYGEATDYLTVTSGGKKTIASYGNVQYATADIKFLPTFSYTSFLIENKSNGKELFTIEDNLGSIAVGMAKVRFVNTSPYFSNNINATLTDNYLLVNALRFKEASAYFLIDPAVSIRINIVGTSIAKTIPTTEIDAGHSYTFWVGGVTNAGITVNKIIYN